METLSGIIKSLIEKVRALFTESKSFEREVKVLEEVSLDFKEKADLIAHSSTETFEKFHLLNFLSSLFVIFLSIFHTYLTFNPFLLPFLPHF